MGIEDNYERREQKRRGDGQNWGQRGGAPGPRDFERRGSVRDL